MRTIKKIHKPIFERIADLTTYRAIPTTSIDYLDPFLFLNHHGPQIYPPNNNGLPFGPHPHRGMETITFILDGDIAHLDSNGEKSVIKSGGVQWMTAGKGLIHSEISSKEFKQDGGKLEILQLWVNLPAKEKMRQPYYKGLQKEQIPNVSSDDGLTKINIISGQYQGVEGLFESVIGLHMYTFEFKKNADFTLDISKEDNIFFYLVRGKLTVNGAMTNKMSLVEFDHNEETISIHAETDSFLLFGFALPLNEPVVSQGPFVMNTREEIIQAYEDYRNGKFGTWQH